MCERHTASDKRMDCTQLIMVRFIQGPPLSVTNKLLARKAVVCVLIEMMEGKLQALDGMFS